MANKVRLRWKLEPAETGLRAVGAAPRGYVYHDGQTEYARIHPNGGGWRRRQNGWYWVVPEQYGIPYANTCHEPVATAEQAKADCEAYCKAEILHYLESRK
jgi:hypothetical protein